MPRCGRCGSCVDILYAFWWSTLRKKICREYNQTFHQLNSAHQN